MFSVEGHLSLFILYPMIFLILHFWPKSRVEVIETSRVGIFRRLTSFYIDMVVVSFGVYPLICLPILILEYLHTGQWAWSIDREIHSRDILVIPIAIVGFYVMFRYLKWHFDKGKQTLGQHILKFKLIPMEQNGEYAIRFNRGDVKPLGLLLFRLGIQPHLILLAS